MMLLTYSGKYILLPLGGDFIFNIDFKVLMTPTFF